MIDVRHVTVLVDGRKILDNVSFHVKKGETKVTLGPSGAGKSSVLKVILGLWRPVAGAVIIGGTDISTLSERDQLPIRRRMSMIFQGNALFDSLTVAENVGYFLNEHHDLRPKEVADRVGDCLEFVNLSDTEEMLPEEISGGMKKRVAIARAIAFHPEIILYDEPTTGLDPVNAKTVTELIMRLKRERGVTAVVVTHILRDAFAVADSLAPIQEGRIVFDGTPAELMNSNNPFVQHFLAEVREEAGLPVSADNDQL